MFILIIIFIFIANDHLQKGVLRHLVCYARVSGISFNSSVLEDLMLMIM